MMRDQNQKWGGQPEKHKGQHGWRSMGWRGLGGATYVWPRSVAVGSMAVLLLR